MSEVTQILDTLGSGDAQAAGKLLPLVYDELRRLAAHRLASESPGQTLQATALVHEAWLKLAGGETERRLPHASCGQAYGKLRFMTNFPQMFATILRGESDAAAELLPQATQAVGRATVFPSRVLIRAHVLSMHELRLRCDRS